MRHPALLDIPQAPVLLLQQPFEQDHPARIGGIEHDPVEGFPAQPGEEQRAGPRARRHKRRVVGWPSFLFPYKTTSPKHSFAAGLDAVNPAAAP